MTTDRMNSVLEKAPQVEVRKKEKMMMLEERVWTPSISLAEYWGKGGCTHHSGCFCISRYTQKLLYFIAL